MYSLRPRNNKFLQYAVLAGVLAVCVWGSMSAAQRTLTYTYDSAGRLTQADYGDGNALAYGYDAGGNPTSVSEPTTTTTTVPTTTITTTTTTTSLPPTTTSTTTVPVTTTSTTVTTTTTTSSSTTTTTTVGTTTTTVRVFLPLVIRP